MKVYISGAITNNPNYFNQFGETEGKLIAKGHNVINPARNQGYTYKEYIDIGLFELMHCDAIYMLEGWEESTGARLEYEYAVAVGLEVLGCKPAYSIQPTFLRLSETETAIIENFISKTDDNLMSMKEMQAIIKMGYEIYRRK